MGLLAQSSNSKSGPTGGAGLAGVDPTTGAPIYSSAGGAYVPPGAQTAAGPATPLLPFPQAALRPGQGGRPEDPAVAAVQNAAGGTTTTTTTPPAPQPTDYYAQYEASLAGARANLTNQYVQAQHSIDQQQNDANANVMQMPGQFKTIANNQAASQTRETGSLLAADTAAGMGGTKGTGGALAQAQREMTAAGTQNAAGNQALVPGLALGVKTQMDAERASLNDAHATAQGALDTAAMGVQASRAAQAEDYAHQTAAEKLSHTQAVNDATTTFKRQVYLQALGSGADLSASSTKVPGMTVGDEKAITASPFFSMIRNEINTGKTPDGKSITSTDIEKTLAQMDQGNGAVQANIQGYSGGAGAGLLSVLKAYYGPTLGLTK